MGVGVGTGLGFFVGVGVGFCVGVGVGFCVGFAVGREVGLGVTVVSKAVVSVPLGAVAASLRMDFSEQAETSSSRPITQKTQSAPLLAASLYPPEKYIHCLLL